ncbi:MAG: DUF6733 family protein [Bacteroidota bacterium]
MLTNKLFYILVTFLVFHTQIFAQSTEATQEEMAMVRQEEMHKAKMTTDPDSTKTIKTEMVEEKMMDKEQMGEDKEMEKSEANAEKQEKASGIAINFVQNSVGGFFPVFLGHVNIKPNLNFTWYNIFWTNASFGTLEAGKDLWLEHGVGLGFSALDGKLYINPSLGLTHGKFLSGGESTVVGDGIVPSVFSLYNQGRFESEFYLAYYKSLRKEGTVTRDFILNWAAAGAKINNHLSIGGFYEQFVLTRVTEGDPTSIYQWLGGYVKVPFGSGHFVRLAAGNNLFNRNEIGEDFYKVNVVLAIK